MKKTPRITDEEAYLKEALAIVHAGNDYRKGNKAHDRMMIAAKAIREDVRLQPAHTGTADE